MTDTGSGREPRFSDDRQWWWDGTQWIPASQAPVPPPPPIWAPVAPPAPSSPVSVPQALPSLGLEPRLSDDQQWWWTGAEWVRASQAPVPPSSPPQTLMQAAPSALPTQPVSSPIPAAAPNATGTWKIKGGTLALENGSVTVRRGRKVEVIPVVTILSVEPTHIGAAAKGVAVLGTASCCLIMLPFALINMFLPHPWYLNIKTQAGVAISILVGKKRTALAIHQAILGQQGRSLLPIPVDSALPTQGPSVPHDWQRGDRHTPSLCRLCGLSRSEHKGGA